MILLSIVSPLGKSGQTLDLLEWVTDNDSCEPTDHRICLVFIILLSIASPLGESEQALALLEWAEILPRYRESGLTAKASGNGQRVNAAGCQPAWRLRGVKSHGKGMGMFYTVTSAPRGK
jgi:hypothetical protein